MITGGAGFIGSHLARALAEKNQVFIYDDLSSGRLRNIQGLDAELIEGSLADLDLLHRSFKGMDYVFHLAAQVSVPGSVDDPIKCHLINQTGTLNVLLAARDCEVRKVVNTSSAAVYGDEPTLPKREDMLPLPLSPYAVAKLAGEHYCQVFQRLYGLATTSLRLFNVFGPRQDPRSAYAAVIPKFMEQARKGEKLTVHGDGSQTRDFIYVDDVVRGFILAAQTPASNGMVINLARGESISLNELGEHILSLYGRMWKGGHVNLPPRAGDIKHSVADIALAKEHLGFAPEFTVKAGLQAMRRGLDA